MSNFLVIDASLLDGGGDILWRSLSFSAAIGVPVRIIKIRVGYKLKRGLWEIDIKAIHLLSQMCEAQMKGVSIGSTVIEFIPRAINGGRYMIDTMSDSSITNVLQLVLPAALLSKNRVVLELKGATNIPGFPHIDYIAEVFKGILEKFGGNIDLQLHRRGYHKGGGHATVTINPVAKFDSVTLTEMGAVELIYGLSYISGEYTIEVARLIAATFTKEVQNITNNVALDCYRETKTVAANASGITAICKTSGGCIMGACAVGRRKVDAEAVGKAAAVELLTPLANFSCVDRHAQDRVIMFMALAEGKSRIRVHKVTPKTQNAMYVATTFTDVIFNVTPDSGAFVIECTGIGFRRRQPTIELKPLEVIVIDDDEPRPETTVSQNKSEVTPSQNALETIPSLNNTLEARKKLRYFLAEYLGNAEALRLVPEPKAEEAPQETVASSPTPNKGLKRLRSEEESPMEPPKKTCKIDTEVATPNPNPPKVSESVRMAIKDTVSMTTQQMNYVHRCLTRAILHLNEEGEGPKFLGLAHKSGWLSITCKDRKSVEWLVDQFPKLHMWPGANLSVVPETELIKIPVAKTFFPRTEAQSMQDALTLLRIQNKGLNTELWEVRHVREIRFGWIITFWLDDPSAKVLRGMNGRVAIGLRTIKFTIRGGTT